MHTQHKAMFTRATSLMLVLWLTLGLVLVGDWFDASLCQAYRGGGAVAGPRGGAAVRGPAGGAAAVGPRGGAAVRTPSGAAAARGPYGGAAARGPNGAVVAAPRGRVAPPPVYGARGAVAVPYPVAPAYYGPTGGGVAAGMALGAMLTVLPAAAMATQAQGKTVYVVDNKCYREVHQNGSTYYEQIGCP